jgi:hypothetical protein
VKNPFIVREGEPAVTWDSSPHIIGKISKTYRVVEILKSLTAEGNFTYHNGIFPARMFPFM